MKALEFKSKIKNNRISIPEKIQSKLEQYKDVRIIVLIDDADEDRDDLLFRDSAKKQFLEGYAEADSIYDHY